MIDCGRDAPAQRIHASVSRGSLGMDAYAFGPEAGALAAALGTGAAVAA